MAEMRIDPRMVKWDESPKIDPSKVVWDTPQQPSIVDRMGRAGGLGARSVVEGASAIPTLMADVAAGGVNLGIEGANKLGAGIDYRMQKPSQVLQRNLTSVGFPEAENATERVTGDVVRTVAGTGAVAKLAEKILAAGPLVGNKIAELLAANQGTQALASAGAGAAGGIARESGAGPTGQLLASLVGGVAGPASVVAAKKVGGTLADVGATIGASFGSKRGVDRLASDAMSRIVGESRDKVVRALQNPSEYVKGAKPTVSEAIAEAQSGKPEQFGGALVRLQKDIYGAKGVEDVLPTVAKQQQAAIKTHLKDLNANTETLRESALNAANLRGINPKSITRQIDNALAVPGSRASAVVSKSLSAIKKKIESLPGAENGKIDAKDLYTVRKEIGNTIGMFSKETANWDKKLTSGLQRQIQKYMDDAIEASGGKGWKEYLSTYSQGRQAAENHLNRLKEAKLIAAGVKGQPPAEIVAGELPKPPTLLHRPMMALNFFLKTIARDANIPVVREVALRMQNPREFAKLLAKPYNDPQRKIAEDIARKLYAASAVTPPEETQSK